MRRTVIYVLTTLALFSLAMVPGTGQAATPEQPAESMEQLHWMPGEWEGAGWVEDAKAGKRTFAYSLRVRLAFDGSMLVLDGVGYEKDSDGLSYAEHVLISGPSTAPGAGPRTYIWRELSSSMNLRLNEAKRTGRSLQVGYPFSRQECDRILAEAERRARCRTGELKWTRVTVSLNDDGGWVQTRELQEIPGDNNSWHTYFQVVLKKMVRSN